MKNPFKALRELQQQVAALEQRLDEIDMEMHVSSRGVSLQPPGEEETPQDTVRRALDGLQSLGAIGLAPGHLRLALRIAGAGNTLDLPDRNTAIAILIRYLEDHAPRANSAGAAP